MISPPAARSHAPMSRYMMKPPNSYMDYYGNVHGATTVNGMQCNVNYPELSLDAGHEHYEYDDAVPLDVCPPAPHELPIPKQKWLSTQAPQSVPEAFQDEPEAWKSIYLRDNRTGVSEENHWQYQLCPAPAPFNSAGYQEYSTGRDIPGDKSKQWKHFQQIFKCQDEKQKHSLYPVEQYLPPFDTGNDDSSGGSTHDGEEVTSKDLQSPIRGQLRKTKMCAFFQKSRCAFGDMCSFAHTKDELQPTPDFLKTKLCFAFSRGCCYDAGCTFAHGNGEVKESDNVMTNTRELCYWSTVGWCQAGAACRYAHDLGELNCGTVPSTSSPNVSEFGSDAGRY